MPGCFPDGPSARVRRPGALFLSAYVDGPRTLSDPISFEDSSLNFRSRSQRQTLTRRGQSYKSIERPL
jgi:hypothetical protein